MDPHKNALRVMDDLHTASEKLATAIARRPSERDADKIRKDWQKIDGTRQKTRAVFRAFKADNRKHFSNPASTDNAVNRTKTKDLRKLHNTLKLWDLVGDVIERHADPQPSPLVLLRQAPKEEGLLLALGKALHQMANTHAQSEMAEAYGCFADIPLPAYLFDQMMLCAYRILNVFGRSRTARFLDVGCGGGITLMMAARYFPVADGLDFDPVYVEAARQFIRITEQQRCSAFEGNGITFDGYADYDIIYFYRPMRDDDLLHQMELQIVNTARPYTVVIAPYDFMFGSRPDFPCTQIFGPLFMTGIDEDEAAQIRADAELSSPEMIKRVQDHQGSGAVWAPVLDVAKYNADV